MLKDMVDLSDDVKILASEVFKDATNKEIFLGFETRLRALWLTKEVNKLGTQSNTSQLIEKLKPKRPKLFQIQPLS